jgi:hypothetical protein
MNEEELNRLIEKYYNGESTEDEEDKLKDYFRQSDVPDAYEAEKALFGYYTEKADFIEPSVGFEERMIAGIDSSSGNKMVSIRRYILPVLTAAAGLLILAGSYFFFAHKSQSIDTFKDPTIAYAETIKILRDVSVKMNRGTQVLEPVGKFSGLTKKSIETINKSTKYVEQNMKNLDLIQKALKHTDTSDNNEK